MEKCDARQKESALKQSGECVLALTLGTPIGITGVDARTSEEDLGRWIAEGEKAAAEHINDRSIARPKSAVMLMIAGGRGSRGRQPTHIAEHSTEGQKAFEAVCAASSV